MVDSLWPMCRLMLDSSDDDLLQVGERSCAAMSGPVLIVAGSLRLPIDAIRFMQVAVTGVVPRLRRKSPRPV